MPLPTATYWPAQRVAGIGETLSAEELSSHILFVGPHVAKSAWRQLAQEAAQAHWAVAYLREVPPISSDGELQPVHPFEFGEKLELLRAGDFVTFPYAMGSAWAMGDQAEETLTRRRKTRLESTCLALPLEALNRPKDQYQVLQQLSFRQHALLAWAASPRDVLTYWREDAQSTRSASRSFGIVITEKDGKLSRYWPEKPRN